MRFISQISLLFTPFRVIYNTTKNEANANG
nr:MAG TPA_asm: hypothetical protein [Caudoviricetes sp.]